MSIVGLSCLIHEQEILTPNIPLTLLIRFNYIALFHTANIFFPDCDLKKSVLGMRYGVFYMAGQMCAAGTRIFVHEDIYDQFLEASVATAKRIKVGPILHSDVQMGALISENHLQKVMNYLEIGKQEGAKIAYGGNRLTDGELAKGCFMEPTIIEGTNDMRIAREEMTWTSTGG